jgi:hypothetical protein
MKYINLLAIILATLTCVNAQSSEMSEEEKDVYNVIVRMFDGMRAGDSSMVHGVFSDDLRMYSNFVDKDGNLRTQEGSMQRFLEAVGTPHDEVWDEQIWNTEVWLELGVASVWTEYAFYRGDQFSHCGIDAFQLIKDEKGDWKILQIIDTRRTNDCDHKKE